MRVSTKSSTRDRHARPRVRFPCHKRLTNPRASPLCGCPNWTFRRSRKKIRGMLPDSFNSIIHANTSINNVQKLQYLWSSLTGDASKVITSLEISDLNYEVAWRLLQERYDNRRTIVQMHVRAIMELPSMVKENAVNRLHSMTFSLELATRDDFSIIWRTSNIKWFYTWINV